MNFQNNSDDAAICKCTQQLDKTRSIACRQQTASSRTNKFLGPFFVWGGAQQTDDNVQYQASGSRCGEELVPWLVWGRAEENELWCSVVEFGV